MKNQLKFSVVFLIASFVTLLKIFSQSLLVIPPEKEKGLKFMVIGDWGRNGTFFQKNIAKILYRYGKDPTNKFIISTGDNFYPIGVKDINDSQWKTSFENIYDKDSLKQVWYPVLGNHDYGSNTQAQIDYSISSKRWKMPSRYYTFSVKISDTISVRFLFIDTSPLIKKNYNHPEKYPDILKQDTIKQLHWIDSILSNSHEHWKIVIGHHPVITGNPIYENEKDLIKSINPMFVKYHVDAYFAGHDHSLQHTNIKGHDIDYFISGAGSLTYFFSRRGFSTKFSEASPGFAQVSITAHAFHLEFIDYRGKVIYKMIRRK